MEKDSDFQLFFLRLPETLSRAQLSAVTGLDRSQVQELVGEGLPTRKVGRSVDFPTVPVVRWLAGRAWRDRWRG